MDSHPRDRRDASEIQCDCITHYTVIDKNGLIREDNLRGGIQLNAVISSLLAEAPGEPDSPNSTS